MLSGLDRWAAEDADCAKAETARQQTVDMAARALALAVTADKAEAYDLAASLRAAAAEATAKGTAVDASVRAFANAAAAADRAVETLKYFMSEIDATLRRRRPDDQGARTLDNG